MEYRYTIMVRKTVTVDMPQKADIIANEMAKTVDGEVYKVENDNDLPF